MTLTSQELIGYLRGEYARASRYRIWLFVVQLAVAIPGAISVVVPDDAHVILYILAITGAALLVIWWLINGAYLNARQAAQAARRATLLLDGLNEPFSSTEIQILRERFVITSEEARKFQKSDYYETKLGPGSARLGEMLEESAFYSERLQRVSANAMLTILGIFLAVFLTIALATTPFVEKNTAFIVIRVFLAILVFGMSSDVLGAYIAHRNASKELKEIRRRLSIADINSYPLADVLLAMADYNAVVDGAPESVPFAYSLRAKRLDQHWRQYQLDRSAARAQRGHP